MEAKRFYNATENRWHTLGRGMTRRLDAHSVWSGVPGEEQLRAWGYEEYVPPKVEDYELVNEE